VAALLCPRVRWNVRTACIPTAAAPCGFLLLDTVENSGTTHGNCAVRCGSAAGDVLLDRLLSQCPARRASDVSYSWWPSCHSIECVVIMDRKLKNREPKSSSVCEADLKGTAAPCKWGGPLPDSILKSFSSSFATRCRSLPLFQEIHRPML
jgi:hypothetical protein